MQKFSKQEMKNYPGNNTRCKTPKNGSMISLKRLNQKRKSTIVSKKCGVKLYRLLKQLI